MQPDLLPLFPLPVVLFPRTVLPLHIFEDRYKEMIGKAIQEKSEFGVVLAVEKGVVNVGCTAVVEDVTKRHPDGRLDIVTVGLRRFELSDINSDESYLRGSVSFFNDEQADVPAEEERQKAVSGYKELRSFMEEEIEEPPEPEWNDPQLSFQLAQAIHDLEFRQTLLVCRSEAQRIRLLAQFFPKALDRQRHITRVKQIAPHNGHGPSNIVP